MNLLDYLERLASGSDLRSNYLDRLRARLRIFADLAASLAGMSTCKRLKVGAVIVTPTLDEVAAIGYNGPAAGLPNDSCRGTEGSCGCNHAEGSAVAKIRGYHRDYSLVALLTCSPCEHCAGLVINSRKVGAVVYRDAYRDPVGLRNLREVGVTVVSTANALAGVEVKGVQDAAGD